MNKKTVGTVAFLSGVVVGMILGAQVVKDGYKEFYKQQAAEDIASVKDSYAKKYDSYTPKSDEEIDEAIRAQAAAEMARNKPDLMDVANGYTDYSAISRFGVETDSHVSEDTDEQMMIPEVINPVDFAEIDDYDVITLYCLSDGVIVDEDNVSILDLIGTVGPNIESHFGEYEEDSVYVRNDRLKAYYEINRDERSYGDLMH